MNKTWVAGQLHRDADRRSCVVAVVDGRRSWAQTKIARRGRRGRRLDWGDKERVGGEIANAWIAVLHQAVGYCNDDLIVQWASSLQSVHGVADNPDRRLG